MAETKAKIIYTELLKEGEVENVIGEYRKHSTDEHGIEYSIEALTQVILRQQG